MPETSPLLALPYIQPSQAQKHVTHNEALRVLDALVQLSVAGLGETTPPASPADGDRHVVGPGATGDWAGHDHEIAVRDSNGWVFYTPQPGWVAYLRDDAQMAAFDGSVWAPFGGGGTPDTLPLLGINASADTTNRLTVAAPATLLNHDGDDHRLAINKDGVTDTATLLYQTGFSGRAEMGLAGEDDFSFKLSADGSTWITALRLDAATGAVSGDSVQQSATDATAGRLMLAQHGLLRADITGTVSEAAGVPTGAVIERGSNATGDWVKWADGTMMCWRVVTMDINSNDEQPFAFPTAMATVLGGAAIGADSGEATGSGSSDRREALADLSAWVDDTGWLIRLRNVIGVDTVDVRLTAQGLWF